MLLYFPTTWLALLILETGFYVVDEFTDDRHYFGNCD